ncbi:hypothetical protein, partial [Trueperella pyogenes]
GLPIPIFKRLQTRVSGTTPTKSTPKNNTKWPTWKSSQTDLKSTKPRHTNKKPETSNTKWPISHKARSSL